MKEGTGHSKSEGSLGQVGGILRQAKVWIEEQGKRSTK